MPDVVLGQVQLPQGHQVHQPTQFLYPVQGQVQHSQMLELRETLPGVDLVARQIELAQTQVVQPPDFLQGVFRKIQYLQILVFTDAFDSSDPVGVEFEHPEFFVPAQFRYRGDVVVAEVKVVEVKGRFLGVHDCGQLVVAGLDRGEEFESVQVFESVEAIEGEIHPFHKFELAYFLP